jgi:hypothetical protein
LKIYIIYFHLYLLLFVGLTNLLLLYIKTLDQMNRKQHITLQMITYMIMLNDVHILFNQNDLSIPSKLGRIRELVLKTHYSLKLPFFFNLITKISPLK